MRMILVYDDDTGVGERYAERLRKLKSIRDNFRVNSIGNADFKESLNILKDRQEKLRQGRETNAGSSIFDEASILILDYDIWKAFDSRSFLTGEEVAYHARCFSKCGLIIGLNQYKGTNIFDLTLKGHPESYADINIWSAQLDNQGLWTGNKEGFRPWYWPQLPAYLESFEKRIKEVVENLEEPISTALGFGKEFQMLPHSARAFIGSNPEKTTFAEFVTDSGNGLRPKDVNENPESIARIGIARISKWIERMVLSGQDILVDAPHLVSRFPSLLLEDHSNVATWNKATNLGSLKELNLDIGKIEEFRVQKPLWVSRPVWLWRKLADHAAIQEVAKPWERETTDFVFCEDSSSFYKREECTEFIATLDSPYIRRFIRRFDEVEYQPMVNMMQQIQ